MTVVSSGTRFDTSSRQEFIEYYEKESLTEVTHQRFQGVLDNMVRLAARMDRRLDHCRVLDVGCGAGTQSMLWAEAGHQVTGVDINAALIETANARAAERSLDVAFRVASATRLPCESASMDVCLMPELLEHVAQWEMCLSEALRVLKPGGILFLSTTNVLCPIQSEFNLPLYSWYPRGVKRRFERLAATTRPELANHARYPAVNWFSFYGLRRYLSSRSMTSFDRFDVMDVSSRSRMQRALLHMIWRLPLARFLAHILTPGTAIYAIGTPAREPTAQPEWSTADHPRAR